MYYVGRHWGTEADGYICSSPKMKAAYNRRPQDFKRRIIVRTTTKEDLVIEEQKYLNLIDINELGIRYYNKNIRADSPSNLGNHHSEDSKRKISEGNRGKIISEETRIKNREQNRIQFEDPEQREMRRLKSLELWNDPVYRAKQSEKKKGKKQSQETINKRSEKVRAIYALRRELNPKPPKRTLAEANKYNMENKLNPIARIIKCPHCGTEGNTLTMRRWHFDKCRTRKEIAL
jgi:NUMOD3 motif